MLIVNKAIVRETALDFMHENDEKQDRRVPLS